MSCILSIELMARKHAFLPSYVFSSLLTLQTAFFFWIERMWSMCSPINSKCREVYVAHTYLYLILPAVTIRNLVFPERQKWLTAQKVVFKSYVLSVALYYIKLFKEWMISQTIFYSSIKWHSWLTRVTRLFIIMYLYVSWYFGVFVTI